MSDPKDLEVILKRLLENETEQVEEKVSFTEAYTGKKYRYANLNGLILAAAQQWSGISFVVMFLVFIL